MHRMVRTKRSGQILGGLFCLVGFGALLVVLWRAWPNVSGSANVFSAFWSEILVGQISVASVVTFKLAYLAAVGTILLPFGVVVLAFSRQIFFASSGSIQLQCPCCKNQWKARRGMGWAECPYCRKFINPQTMKKV